MTGEGEEEEERGSSSIAMCSSVWGVKCVLLTQFVAVHLSSTRINRVHLQLYFHAVLYEMFVIYETQQWVTA